MKKKGMALGALLMAVAITGYSVSGTYAKYISSYGITDEARVAKWDFTETNTNTVDLFQQSYSNVDGVYVASSDASKVIAPGTSGEYSYSVSGTAETNFKITNTIQVVNNVKLKGVNPATGKEEVLYDPLRFSVDGTTWLTSDEFNDQVGGETSQVYAANTEGNGGGTIYWMWAFDSKAPNGDHIVDELDTQLGEKVLTDDSLKVTATISTTVEQTQEAATPATVKPATVTNKIDAESAKELATKWGYQAEKAKEVIFDGKNLSGTIYKTTNPQAGNVMGSHANTGYYYAVTIKVAVGDEITYYGKNADGSQKTNTWTKTDAADDLTIMLSLNDKAATKSIKYLVNGKEYTIDYANLTFAE